MTRLIADGLSAAEAAQQTLTQGEIDPQIPPSVAPPIVNQLADQLRTALDAFDGAAAHTALDTLFASVSPEIVLADVVVPYLRDLGDRWEAGRASVAQEHFASNLLRGRLLAIARDWDSGTGQIGRASCRERG